MVPREIIRAKKAQTVNRTIRVLDPFMGSGTTAVEAKLQHSHVYGVELDAFARLVAQVSTRGYTEASLTRLEASFKRISSTWQKCNIDEQLSPDLKNINYWFREDIFVDLLRLKSAIYELVKHEDDLEFLRIVLADVVRPCSNAERQSLKPYISTKYIKTPAEVGATFEKSFNTHLKAIREYSSVVDSVAPVEFQGHDAAKFSLDREVDVAITSPPYINALDYVRCIKLESSWAGCANDKQLAAYRKEQIGESSRQETKLSEEVEIQFRHYADAVDKLDSQRAQRVANYFRSMARNMTSVYDALGVGGEYHLIVGNSKVRGVEIPTHEVLAAIGQKLGFTWTKYYSYSIKDHRTSIPRKGQGGKINYEHVITLSKS